MNSRKFSTLMTITLMLTFGFSRLLAADFSPALEYQLKQANDNDFISAIIILESPINIQALDVRLHEEKASFARRHLEVVNALKFNAESTQPAFRLELDAAKVRGELNAYTAYWIDNIFVVHAQKQFIESLRDRGDIVGITENFRGELIEPIIGSNNTNISDDELATGRRPHRNLDEEQTTPGQDAIRATEVNRVLGITGQGVLVADLDTGVDGSHPALASRWRGNHAPLEECWMDALGGQPNPTDTYGHGTHVMGTIAGRAISGTDTNTVGSAPNAEWIANNAINQGVGGDFDNDIIEAFQWFTDPDGDPETIDDVPDVIQNSWRVNSQFPGYAECWDMWNTVILNCEAGGTVITWSAGNESTFGIGTPPNYSFSATQIFAVGAVNATDFDAPYPLADFSSQGPATCEPGVPNNIKPEIAAPGVNVYSCVPGGGYDGSWSGTSMAGPHVAGVVALMREACPNCDPQTIKEAIMQTAVDYGPQGDDNQYGAGFIDAYESVLLVMNLGTIAGTVTRQNGTPLANTLVSVLGVNQTVLTDESGHYEIRLQDGTYNATFSRFGYFPQTINGIEVLEETQTTVDIVLVQAPSITISGHVLTNGQVAVPNVGVNVTNQPVDGDTTDANGFYAISCPAGLTYTLIAGTETMGALRQSVTPATDVTLNFILPEIVECYDFESDAGWTIGAPGDNATDGFWNRMDPEQTVNGGGNPQPEDDHSVEGVSCFVTDGNAGANAGTNDLDGGHTTLLSPVWDLTNYGSAFVDMYSWFSNDLGNNPGTDTFHVGLTSDGVNWVTVISSEVDWELWKHDQFFVEEYVPLTSTVRMRIVADDSNPSSLVEVAVDDICLYGGMPEAPTPRLRFSTDSLNFGNVTVGDSLTLTAEAESFGTAVVNFSGVTITAAYTTDLQGNLSIVPGINEEFEVKFRPTAETTYNGYLVVTSNAVSSPDTLWLGGTGVPFSAVDPNEALIPTQFYLAQNYPNPFNPTTQIEFGLPVTAQVKISVFDVLGREVKVLANRTMAAGVHQLEWDGSSNAGGIYWIKMESGDFQEVRKAALIK